MNNSVELWTKLLSYYVNYDSLEMAIEAFQAGVRSLKGNSMPLWEIIILYMQNTHPKLVRPILNIYIHINTLHLTIIDFTRDCSCLSIIW